MSQPKLIVINPPPYSDGSRRVVGAEVGSPTSMHNMRTTKVVKAVEGMQHRAHDVRTNRNTSSLEKAARMREVVAPALKELNEAYAQHRAAQEEVRKQVAQLSPVKANKDLPFADVLYDIELCKHYKSLPIAQRAAIDHALRREPWQHLRLAEALERAPQQISGIDNDTHNANRIGLIKFFKPAEYARLTEEMAQLENTENALRVGMTMAREASTTMDVIEHAKDAFMGLQGAPDPVRWPAVPDEVQAERLAANEPPAPGPAQQFAGAQDAE